MLRFERFNTFYIFNLHLDARWGRHYSQRYQLLMPLGHAMMVLMEHFMTTEFFASSILMLKKELHIAAWGRNIRYALATVIVFCSKYIKTED